MVDYETWVAIAFDVAAEDVESTRVFERAGMVWQSNKSRLKTASEREARRIGRNTL